MPRTVRSAVALLAGALELACANTPDASSPSVVAPSASVAPADTATAIAPAASSAAPATVASTAATPAPAAPTTSASAAPAAASEAAVERSFLAAQAELAASLAALRRAIAAAGASCDKVAAAFDAYANRADTTSLYVRYFSRRAALTETQRALVKPDDGHVPPAPAACANHAGVKRSASAVAAIGLNAQADTMDIKPVGAH